MRCPKCKMFHRGMSPELALCEHCENLNVSETFELTTESKAEIDAILAVEEEEEKRAEQAQQN